MLLRASKKGIQLQPTKLLRSFAYSLRQIWAHILLFITLVSLLAQNIPAIVIIKSHMPKIEFDNFELTRGRMCRRVLVLCLALFAIYPLLDAALDAYSDHALHDFRMSPDERANMSSRKDGPSRIIGFSHRISFSVTEDPIISEFELKAVIVVTIRSTHTSSPLSSDSSPPQA